MSGAAAPRQGARNARTALLAALVAAAMVGLAFASVPLYRLFCQVTGFAGTTQTRAGADAPGAVGRRISVRFDASRSPALPWQFRPEDTHHEVTIGERSIAFYTAKNLSDRPVTGTATFNVTPSSAGQHFVKVQCFCFERQTLQPGEEVRMPVVFYVDPGILRDPNAARISEITLSYTFYPVDSAQEGS
jgi:cytochrome c oxidase assembly protein subunit 11